MTWYYLLSFLPAVQIHFCNENHWVVSSFLDGVIHLYDSLPSSKVSAGLEEQLAWLYGHLECSLDDGGLTIHNVPVQVQQGTSDCGLFAVAFAYHAALGDKLDKVTFDQDNLCDHLSSCFSNSCLTGFPQRKMRRAYKTKVTFIPLYCYCHLPETYVIDNMVACDHCKKWFHHKCVNYDIANLGDWLCRDLY